MIVKNVLKKDSRERLLKRDKRMRHDHRQHQGETVVQERMGAYGVAEWFKGIVEDEISPSRAKFFGGLEYLAVGVLDLKGRPWVTVVTGEKNFVQAVSYDTLLVHTELVKEDPVAVAIDESVGGKERLWAGLGVDFTNRRRNKIAGVINYSFINGKRVELELQANENLGNCPKYITVRDLTRVSREPKVVFDERDEQFVVLSQDEKDVIETASTIFLATRHIDDTVANSDDLGVNHRGGPPGFVRVLERDGKTMIVIPDYSGNRFYQSLGNVESDRVAGVVIPSFKNGDMLHLTGLAENLFDQDAEEIMPRTKLITVITVTGRVFIKSALPLQLISEEYFSPYNPEVRLLRSELESKGAKIFSAESEMISATLSDVEPLSSQISRFTFTLSTPINYTPGGYIILDFSKIFQKEYSHMNDRDPQLLNDDFIRTWTISSSPDVVDGVFQPMTTIQCTIKRISNGKVTSFLHRLGNRSIQVGVKGVGGDFSCYKNGELVKKDMIWIAGGVGVTPFLSMLSALERTVNVNVNINVALSVRGDEISIADLLDSPLIQHRFIYHTGDHSDEKTLHNSTISNRRIIQSDILEFPGISTSDIYLCGPSIFMDSIGTWLAGIGVPVENIHKENFF